MNCHFCHQKIEGKAVTFKDFLLGYLAFHKDCWELWKKEQK